MVKDHSHLFFCTSNRCSCCLHRFDNLSALFERSELTWNEKALWLWLATQCARNHSLACDYSYEQVSHALDLSCKQVHRALFRLRAIGFLSADLPIWYYELSIEMCTIVYTLKPVIPDKRFLKKLQHFREDPEGFIQLLNSSTVKPININLLRKYF